MCSPSEKDKRYDRQLRLWGNHGQAALESAHVCLLNATSTGTEILKNLILPGVGRFTLVDNCKTSAQDLGNNFFVCPDQLGKSRAEGAVKLLLQLNDVKGDYIDEDIEGILRVNPDFFSQFTIVIATGLPHSTLERIGSILWSSAIPFLVARSYGLLGFIRIALPHHQIIESHPDNYHEDLRLDCPFPRLVKYMDSIDLVSLDDTKHSNVPYLVILYKYLQQWKDSHNGHIPKNYRQKVEFKKLIQNGIRCNDSVPLDEENFDEAIQNVNSLVIPYKVPLSVQAILDSQSCTSITPESNSFWLLARSLREFMANEGQGRLPLRGSIPDMTSSSDMYIDLCRVYQAQAREDMEAVASHLGQLLVSIGKPANFISENDIKQFCRNSTFLHVLQYRSISDEMDMPNRSTLGSHLDNPESDIVYYVLLCAAEQFFEMYQNYPGSGDGEIEADVTQMKSIVTSLLQKWQLAPNSVRDDHIVEFCRYGAGEVHSVAAFIGGIAAQEAIKIITCQFVPLNNTFIYNAATSTTATVII